MSDKLVIRPYARLLTMLGEQLIKNESIAIIELMKNSYDADASFVKLNFKGFEKGFRKMDESQIVIEDDGNGMDREILEHAWLSPATPIKLKQKKLKSFTDKGRIVQGEKGIGRFAIFKLGKKIQIITRRQKRDKRGRFIDKAEEVEYVLTFDFTAYDDDFLSENGEEKELYLDNLSVGLEVREPIELIEKKITVGATIEMRKPYGTIIKISALKSDFSVSKINKIENDISRMQPIVSFSNEVTKEDIFRPYISVNGSPYYSSEDNIDRIRMLLNEAYTFYIDGTFDPVTRQYFMEVVDRSRSNNKQKRTIGFDDPKIRGIKRFREYFEAGERELECGKFSFKYYIFDIDTRNRDESSYALDDEEINLIKSHRIYLYRDGVRVMPYGDKEDDWLGLDVARGVESAGNLVSNDQTVGFVFITQEDNPRLRDKTNREGLLDDDNSFDDFRFANELFLRYFRAQDYKQYLIGKRNRVYSKRFKAGTPVDIIDAAKTKYQGKAEIIKMLDDIKEVYLSEKDVYNTRISTSENLAAVGLATRTGTHDARIEISRAKTLLNKLLKDISRNNVYVDKEVIIKQLKLLQKSILSIHKRMTSIQKLFPSTRNWTKDINVQQIINLAYEMSKSALESKDIKCVIEVMNQPLIIKMTEAALMQIFINLIDNSLYWTEMISGERQIRIFVDGFEQKVIFSDNGPGINKKDIPFIFEAFYSAKADGSGLGLYISERLMERYGYRINLASDNECVMSGANFILDFGKRENDE